MQFVAVPRSGATLHGPCRLHAAMKFFFKKFVDDDDDDDDDDDEDDVLMRRTGVVSQYIYGERFGKGRAYCVACKLIHR